MSATERILQIKLNAKHKTNFNPCYTMPAAPMTNVGACRKNFWHAQHNHECRIASDRVDAAAKEQGSRVKSVQHFFVYNSAFFSNVSLKTVVEVVLSPMASFL